MSRLDGVRACVFDAYGTLFDLASATSDAAARLGGKADALNALWRTKQLEYTWLRGLMGRHADFERVTAEALDHALESLGVGDRALAADLMAAYRRLDCYPEVPDVLRRLKDAGLPRAVLTNGSPEMTGAGLESAGVAGLLDAVLSVEEVGVFKPHPSTYRMARQRFGLEAREIAFFSSNAWDVAGASAFGLRAVWVNRKGAPPERLPGGPEAVLSDLAGAPALVGV